jgi:hypothetical protein
VRFKPGRLAAVKNESLPPALAFGTKHFLVFFDDVPFSVADDANHFDSPAVHAPCKRQAFGRVFLSGFKLRRGYDEATSLRRISLVVLLRVMLSDKAQLDEFFFSFPEIRIRVMLEIFRDAESSAAFLQQQIDPRRVLHSITHFYTSGKDQSGLESRSQSRFNKISEQVLFQP